MDRETRRVFEGIAGRAASRGMVGAPDGILVDGHVRRGLPVPDRLLPGRMVMALSPADREALGRLTSADAGRYRYAPLA